MVLSNKEWLDKMDEIISAIQNGGDIQVIEDMLSNMWISSVTYNVGDYVLYNNNIWKCLVQNSNIAPSEGTTWTMVNITSEISTLNSNLDKTNTTLAKKSTVKRVTTSVTSKIPGGAFGTFTPGGAWDGFSYNSGSAVVSFVYGGAGGITILQIKNTLSTEITVTAYFWKYQIS